MTTESTKKAYLQRAESILSRFERETENDRFANLDSLFQWIHHLISTLSTNTRRQYKAALTHWLECNDIQIDKRFWSELFRSSVTKKEVQQKYGKRTSAKKAKQMKQEYLEVLEAKLIRSCSKVSDLTLWLLKASQTFGLRPVEWATAEYVVNAERILGVRVKNAKNSQGRSFGEYRTIWLTHFHTELSAEILDAIICGQKIIEHFSETKNSLLDSENEEQEVDSYQEQVQKELKACRALLRQINTRLENSGAIKSNQRITLYSARHQFAANAKKSGSMPIEIAAVMGHGALDTNEKYYGRKVNGKGGFSVVANEDDMDAINDKKNKSSIEFSR